MSRKLISLLLVVVLVLATLAGCAQQPAEQKTPDDSSQGGDTTKIKVGMVTDAGTIDDKSFNQGTWEGIQKAAKEFNLESKYLKPSGTTEADYLNEIDNLYENGFRFIVTPGFKFSSAVYKAQETYKDCKFVIIDSEPADADGNSKTAENTASVYFAEEQSGFMAGFAAAVELKEGEFGFIGGMKIPSVQKFNWGFQQGINYANENYGTKVSLKADNVIYQGSFDNAAAGQQLAAQMYEKGVKCIFIAAGGTGVGAINEAKTRRAGGADIWCIGVDVDQYDEGIYDDKNNSVVLTSAIKKVDVVSYEMAKAFVNNSFVGGKVYTYDAKSKSVGLPEKNPNLSQETMDKANEVFEKLVAGEIKVSAEQGDLID